MEYIYVRQLRKSVFFCVEGAIASAEGKIGRDAAILNLWAELKCVRNVSWFSKALGCGCGAVGAEVSRLVMALRPSPRNCEVEGRLHSWKTPF